jgi:hypothetical protein
VVGLIGSAPDTDRSGIAESTSLVSMTAGNSTISPITRRVGTAAVTALAVLGIVATTLIGLDDVAEGLATGGARSSVVREL